MSGMFDLTGKVCVVTGGNGGIGLGMADALAGAGADVCILGRNEKKNREAAEKLAKHGRRVLALTADVSDESSLDDSFARAVEELGGVDACFANAGIGGRGVKFHEIALKEWNELIGVNLTGVFLTFRAAVRHMLKTGRQGSLVATSSLSAVQGLPRSEHYAAAKAGLIAMVRGISVEYGRQGIRANAIVPGWIQTDMVTPLFSMPKFVDAVLPRIPQRRWGTPEDFGPIAVYFASDASRYHSGDTVVIDGAYHLF
ncbi:MAG: SDR family oxidoreductase [Pseudomonadota bacterium]